MLRSGLRLFSAVALYVGCALAADAPTPLFFWDFVSGIGPFVTSNSADYDGQSVAVEAVDGATGDFGLVLKEPAHRYAVTAKFPQAISNGDGEDLVIQYELRLQNGLDCGGGYIKLYEAADDFDASAVTPNTPYIIMFGPDRCGATDKIHFIVRWRNPRTEAWEEKHVTNAPKPANDKLSHLYTLIVRADGTFTIKVDNKDVRSGSLNEAEDFSPPVLPSAEINDPSDVKPSDWVDAAQIPDPEAKKPADWDEQAPSTIEDAAAVKPLGWLDDEPASISDPAATKPDEWEDEEDGVWEAPTIPNPKCVDAPGCGVWMRPLIANPAYKGIWHAPLIANPAYKGPWAPRKIANPAFYVDPHVGRLGGAAISSIGVEVWTMSGGITFDGFLVTRDEIAAEAFGSTTWQPKHAAQKAESDARDHEVRLAAAEKGTWADKAVFWANEAVALAKRQPVATAVTAVVLLATLIALVLFGCSGGPAAPPRPMIYEPEDERAESAAARRDARAEAAAAAAASKAPTAVAAAPGATTAPQAEGDGVASAEAAGLRQRTHAGAGKPE